MRWIVTGVWALVCAAGLHGADISIVKDRAQKSSIDLSGLNAGGAQGALFRNVLAADLARSGWFTVRESGGAIRVAGTCTEGAGLRIQLTVDNVATGVRFLSENRSADGARVRVAAHEVADKIVEAVKGGRGMAAARVLCVGSSGGKKDVYVCDIDGHGVVRLTQDGSVCLSPAWFPDAQRVLYTGYLGGFPDVYLVDLRSNQRTRIAAFPGMNAGADVSADGRTIVLTLSKDGNPELYTMTPQGRVVGRITRTQQAAEASPSWAPDGSRIVFVSDKSRSPQLYVAGRDGSQPRLLTARGSENVAPDWGANGKIVFSSRRGGVYQIVMIDPDTREETELTSDGANHEDPSWAPDGRHVVYTRTSGYKSDLYLLDTMGDPEVPLLTRAGDWRFPACSP